MTRRYNIYEMMLRAGEKEGGGGTPEPEQQEEVEISTEELEQKAEGEQEVEAKTEDEVETKPPAMVSRDAMLQRVAQLTARNKKLQEELEKKGVATPTEDAPTTQGLTPGSPEFQAAVSQEAARQLAITDFNNRCNDLAEKGESTYKNEWNEALSNLRMLGDDNQIPLELLQGALEADDPAKVVYELGQDPKRAMKLLSLPPLKRVAEMVKIGLQASSKPVNPASPPAKRSNAPAPIEPLKGTGASSDGLGDEIDDATWIKNRNEQLRAQQGR